MSNPNAPEFDPRMAANYGNWTPDQQFQYEQFMQQQQQAYYAQQGSPQSPQHEAQNPFRDAQVAQLSAQLEEMRKANELTRQNVIGLQNFIQHNLPQQAQAGPSQFQQMDMLQIAGLMTESFSKALSVSNNKGHKIETVKPDPFTGKPHEDLEMWIKQIETYLELSRTSEDTRARVAAQFLKGTACTWFYNLKPPPATWEVLKEMLQKQFELLDKHEKAMKTFFMNLATGKHGKGVQDLGIAFQETLSVIESDPDCQMPEKIKVFLYRNSIKHIEAAKAIVQKKPATLAEAIAIAVQMQNIVRTVEPPARDTPARDTRRDDPMNLNAVQKPEPTESEKAELDRRKAAKLCLNCGQDGHQSTGCKADPEGSYAKKFAVWRKSVAKAGQQARQASGNGRRAAQKDGQ